MSLKQEARTGADVLLGLSPEADDGLVGETGTPTLTNENRSLSLMLDRISHVVVGELT